MPSEILPFIIAIYQDLDLFQDNVILSVPYNTDTVRVRLACGDLFEWGLGHEEPVEEGDQQLILSVLEDLDNLVQVDDGYFHLYLEYLIASKKNKTRPQGAWLHNEDYCPKGLVPLFESYGPPRESSVFNPKPS